MPVYRRSSSDYCGPAFGFLWSGISAGLTNLDILRLGPGSQSIWHIECRAAEVRFLVGHGDRTHAQDATLWEPQFFYFLEAPVDHLLAGADALPFTRQALRHHFGSKEKLYAAVLKRISDTLMGELLDNKRRAETSRSRYPRPFLETLTDMVEEVSPGQTRSRHAALSFVYQVLGAITYFVVSEPTLTQIFGKTEFAELRDGYEAEPRTLISTRLDSLS